MSSPTTRRLHRSPAQIQTLLTAYDRQGLSAREFARQHGIPVASLGNWLRRRRSRASAPSPRWIEVMNPAPAAAPGPVVTIDGLPGLQLHLAAGFPPGPVAELINLLRRP